MSLLSSIRLSSQILIIKDTTNESTKNFNRLKMPNAYKCHEKNLKITVKKKLMEKIQQRYF